jgi:hypothetical protein
VAKSLIGFGVALVAFGFLLAFSIYGEILLFFGIVAIASGAWSIGRGQSRPDTTR